MKLDGEWISKMAERMTDAEDALEGAWVFTHKPAIATTQADVAVLEAQTVEIPGYSSSALHPCKQQ